MKLEILINFYVVEFESIYLRNKQMDYTENTQAQSCDGGGGRVLSEQGR